MSISCQTQMLYLIKRKVVERIVGLAFKPQLFCGADGAEVVLGAGPTDFSQAV